MRIFLATVFCLCFISLNAQTWNQVTEYPGAERHHPITFSLDGSGYLLCGSNTGSPFKDFYQYDPLADSWQTLDPFPGPSRGFSYGVTEGGIAYIGFGVGEMDNSGIELKDLWKFDPDNQEWTELSNCTCFGRHHPAFLALNNKLYVGLGSSNFGNLDDWWEYDIAEDKWTRKAFFPGVPRHHPYYFTIGEYVYVGFGHADGFQILNDFYRYDPSNDTWTEMASLPAEGRVAGTQFTHNGKGYILAGQNEQHINFQTGEFWQYDPNTNSWAELEAFPIGSRWAPGSFVIDDMLYLTSGEDNFGGYNNDVWQFDLSAINTGTNEIQINTQDLNLFPNPATDLIYLEQKEIDFSDYSIAIFDILGNQVYSAKIATPQLDVSTFPKGIYNIILTGEESAFQKSFVKQ